LKYKTSGGYITAIVTRWQDGTSAYAAHLQKNLLTNNGRDVFHALCYSNTSAGTRGFGYVGVTTDTANPSASDTSLAQELAASGFSRADATTKTHSAGTNSSTIEHTFTASGTVNSIVKSGTFNNASSTVLGHEATFTSASLISGDTLKVTWTLNLG